MKPMMETTEYHPDGTGNYFTFQNRFIGLTYGAKMTDRFSFGITFKHVSEDMADYGMNAVLMDMGTFYWTGYKSGKIFNRKGRQSNRVRKTRECTFTFDRSYNYL